MEKNKTILYKIHTHLQSEQTISDDLRKQWLLLEKEIHEKLHMPTLDAMSPSHMANKSRDLAAEFAGKYPNTEALLIQLTNILQSMGI